MKPKDYEILQVLGEPNRFRIFKLLLETQKEICNCEFVDALGIPKYGLSKHLDALVKAGLVKSRKEGRWVYYSACSNISGFCSALCKAITDVRGSTYDQDSSRFGKRLHLRVKGKCVLGIQGKKLMKCC
jgi:DNA-binding transcriptional ArsR family regulator